MSRLRRLIQEIHRRSLWQVLGIYLGGAWVTFQIVQTLTEGLGLPEWVPGVALVALIVGLPIVLATAFVQEGVGAQEGSSEAAVPSEADGAGLHLVLTWRNLVLGAVLLIALAGVGVAGWFLMGGAATRGPETIRSIAVLPFENLMRDPAQDYFVDGMTEALITEVAKIGSLKVISRTSVMLYKGTAKAAPKIARELGVEGLIEGSVLRDGDQVRITAQLIHGPTDRHLWAESYTNTITNVLSLHSEVALAITTALGAILTPDESRRIASAGSVRPEAYEAYLLGVHFLEVKTEEGLRTAIHHFGRATELDAGFALALARTSFAYVELAGYSIDKPKDVSPLARRAALRALELDGSLGQAHAALALVAQSSDWEWSEAERRFRRAIELAPNDAQIRTWYAWLLLQIGRYRGAVSQAEFALELDPKSHAVKREAATVFLMSGHRERGWALLTEVYREDPSYIPVLDSIFHYHVIGDDFDDAIRIAEENRNASPDASLPHLVLAFSYAAAGDPEKARETVDAAQRTFGEERLPNATLGHIHVTLGEMDEAFRAYEKGFDNREWLMTWLRVNPYVYENLALLRQDPRYWDLMRRMNFPPFPREHPGYAEEQAQQARGVDEVRRILASLGISTP